MPENTPSIYNRRLDPHSQNAGEDQDVYDLIIQMYKDWGLDYDLDLLGNRVQVLEENRGSSAVIKNRILKAFFDEDKGPRRDYIVRVGQMVAEREAGRVAEEQRLQRGKSSRGRVSNILQQRKQNAINQAAESTTSLGRTLGLVESMNKLGHLSRLG